LHNIILKEYFYKLYNVYLNYLENLNETGNYSKDRLIKSINQRSEEYKKHTSKKRMVIDYIAGQTDSFFLRECEYNFKEFNKENLYN
jgi:dGTP triphosphohydrolase